MVGWPKTRMTTRHKGSTSNCFAKMALAPLLLLWPCQSSHAQTWSAIGPSPLSYIQGPTNPVNFNSGRIAAIAVDPSDKTHWLIGAGNGGVWETHDAGSNFIPLSDAWPTL